MKTLAERMKEALDDAGEIPANLARACKVTPTSVSNWLTGETKSLKSKTAIRASEFLGVNQLWLTEGLGQKRGNETSKQSAVVSEPVQPSSDFIPVRRVQIKASAGITGFHVEPLVGDGPPIFFRADWIASKRVRASRLVALRVNGASMEPGLYDGDLVVVNTDETNPKDGEVYVINYEGEIVIKRMRRDGGQWWLASDNPDKRLFSDKHCDEHASVIGHVIYKQSEHI